MTCLEGVCQPCWVWTFCHHPSIRQRFVVIMLKIAESNDHRLLPWLNCREEHGRHGPEKNIQSIPNILQEEDILKPGFQSWWKIYRFVFRLTNRHYISETLVLFRVESSYQRKIISGRKNSYLEKASIRRCCHSNNSRLKASDSPLLKVLQNVQDLYQYPVERT